MSNHFYLGIHHYKDDNGDDQDESDKDELKIEEDEEEEKRENESKEEDTEIIKVLKFTINILKVPETDKHCVEWFLVEGDKFRFGEKFTEMLR